METSQRESTKESKVAPASAPCRTLDVSGRAVSHRQFDTSERSAKSVQLPSTSQAESETSGNHLFATKDNSAFKWQRARGVVGALEVRSEPTLNVRADMQVHTIRGKEKIFQDALQAWEDLELRDSFIKSCENLPAEMCCCGLMRDQDGTKRRFVALLNDGWCRQVNKVLQKGNRGIKLDAFLWNWQNASGKAETNIILLRLFELSSYRFRRASNDGSQEFELLDLEDVEDEAGNGNVTLDVEAPRGSEMAR